MRHEQKPELILDTCRDLDAMEDDGKEEYGFEIRRENGDLVDLQYGYLTEAAAQKAGEKALKGLKI